MCLLLFLIRCLAVVRNSRNSRFGGFNSRLGRFEFPFTTATGIGSQEIDFVQIFRGQTAALSGKSAKFPAQREKPGISSVGPALQLRP